MTPYYADATTPLTRMLPGNDPTTAAANELLDLLGPPNPDEASPAAWHRINEIAGYLALIEEQSRAGAEAELLALRPLRDAAVAWKAAEDAYGAVVRDVGTRWDPETSFQPDDRTRLHAAMKAQGAAYAALMEAIEALSGQAASVAPDGWVPDVFLEAKDPPEDSDGDSPPKLGVAEYVGTATTVDGREFVGDPPGFDPHSEGL